MGAGNTHITVDDVCFTYILFCKVRSSQAQSLLRDDRHSQEVVVVKSCVDTNIMIVHARILKQCKQTLQLLITTLI